MASSPCSASRSWFDVGTEPQPADLVAVLAARAEEENRQPGAVAETPTDIESGLAPEHHVEQHAIDAAPTEGSDCGRATRGRVHLEALRLQEIAHEPHDLRLVLDEQHRLPAVRARFTHCRNTVWPRCTSSRTGGRTFQKAFKFRVRAGRADEDRLCSGLKSGGRRPRSLHQAPRVRTDNGDRTRRPRDARRISPGTAC
jgi:hypothetical protein